MSNDKAIEAAIEPIRCVIAVNKPVAGRIATAAIEAASPHIQEEERAAVGWQPIETAPKDGTAIIAWCVHPFANEAGDDDYRSPVVAHWIDHNGGGWTWHGLCGLFTHWMPLPPPPGDHLSSQEVAK